MRSSIHSFSVSCDVQSDRLLVLVDQLMYERRGEEEDSREEEEVEVEEAAGAKEERGGERCETEGRRRRRARNERGFVNGRRDNGRTANEPNILESEERWKRTREKWMKGSERGNNA